LALRARARGTGEVCAPFIEPPFGAVPGFGRVHVDARLSCWKVATELKQATRSFASLWHPGAGFIAHAGKIANSELLTAGNPTV